MFLIKILLVHRSRRLTGELKAYIRRHPASTRRPSVCLSILSKDSLLKPFDSFFPICHRSITGVGGGGVGATCSVFYSNRRRTKILRYM